MSDSVLNYIPCTVNKPNLMEILQSKLKQQSFIPFGFSIEENLVEAARIFVPCVILDGKVTFAAKYSAEKVEYSNSAQKVPDNKFYDLEREGDISISEVPFFLSEKATAEELSACGAFDFSKESSGEKSSSAFEDSQIEELSESTEKAIISEEIKRTSALLLKKELSAFTKSEEKELSVNFTEENKKIIYVPFWVVTFTWKEKSFRVIVNGQTGNVSGAFPSDRKRYWSLFAEVGIPVALIAGGLLYLLIKVLLFSVFMGLFAGSFVAVIVCSNKQKRAKVTNGNPDYLNYFQKAEIKYTKSEDKFLYSRAVARIPDSSEMGSKK